MTTDFTFALVLAGLGLATAKSLYPLRLWKWRLSFILGSVCLFLSLAFFLYAAYYVAAMISSARGPYDAMGAVWGPIYARICIGFFIQVALSGYCDAFALLMFAVPLVPFASGFTSFAGDVGLCVGWLGGQITILAARQVD